MLGYLFLRHTAEYINALTRGMYMVSDTNVVRSFCCSYNFFISLYSSLKTRLYFASVIFTFLMIPSGLLYTCNTTKIFAMRLLSC
jgi:hypothetical protein